MNLPTNPSESFKRRNAHLYVKEVMQTDATIRPEHTVRTGVAVITGGAKSGKKTRAKLNKLEQRWLEELGRRGYIPVHVQSVTLHLGFDCRYTVDFFTPFSIPIEEPDEIAFTSPIGWEVKGFRRDDAMVKIRVAARMYSWIQFILVEWDGKQWKETIIQP